MSRKARTARAVATTLAVIVAGLTWAPRCICGLDVERHPHPGHRTHPGRRREPHRLRPRPSSTTGSTPTATGATPATRSLISEAEDAPTVGSGCSLTGGRWYSYYDGVSQTNASALDIDHMVPLAEAWDSGAGRLDDAAPGGLRQRPRRQPHPRRRDRLPQPQQGRPGRRGVDAADQRLSLHQGLGRGEDPLEPLAGLDREVGAPEPAPEAAPTRRSRSRSRRADHRSQAPVRSKT